MREKVSHIDPEKSEAGTLLSMSEEMKQQIQRLGQAERSVVQDPEELEVITYQDGDEARLPELHCGWGKATKCL